VLRKRGLPLRVDAVIAEVRAMSAFPSEAVVERTSMDGRFVPIATISTNRKTANCGDPSEIRSGVLDQAAARTADAFRFLRHQPSSPPPAKIRPGRPAPMTGPGTATRLFKAPSKRWSFV
jgi:hypothetical protein